MIILYLLLIVVSHTTYCSSVKASDPVLEHCLTNWTASMCLRLCISCPLTRTIVSPGLIPFNAALLPDVTLNMN